jgi:hypothetical protein
MLQTTFAEKRRPLFSLFSVAIIGASLSAGVSAAEPRYSKHQADAETCERFGARYGTQAYTDCMLEQQRRRDERRRLSLERTLITSEIAKNGQIMAERARRQRCDRNPDRRECRRR